GLMSLISAADLYLEFVTRRDVALTAIAAPKLDASDTAEGFREKGLAIGAEIAAVAAQPVPVAEVLPKLMAQIDRVADAGRPTGIFHALEGATAEIQWPRRTIYTAVPESTDLLLPVDLHDALGVTAWLMRDRLKEMVAAELGKAAQETEPDAIDSATRAQR